MTLRVADLFAGAGGASTGLQLAASAAGVPLDLVAVNHWPAAVQTHTVNHPEARHLCEALERVDYVRALEREIRRLRRENDALESMAMAAKTAAAHLRDEVRDLRAAASQPTEAV